MRKESIKLIQDWGPETQVGIHITYFYFCKLDTEAIHQDSWDSQRSGREKKRHSWKGFPLKVPILH